MEFLSELPEHLAFMAHLAEMMLTVEPEDMADYLQDLQETLIVKTNQVLDQLR